MLKFMVRAAVSVGLWTNFPTMAAENPTFEHVEIQVSGTSAVQDPAIERGSNLAAAGNCISCHTRPGGEPFSGGLPFEAQVMGLRGTIHSTNITPDMETGIGKWTEADLIKAMHEGVAPGGRHLLPAFPYTAFTKVTDDDVKAIYAYLKTVTPVKYTAPGNSFIFSQRWTMAFWNALFFKPGRFEAVAGKSDDYNRGAYLVDGLGHCSACHSPRNFAGAEIASKAYAGGAILDLVGKDEDKKIRAWSAPNLTPVKGGLASWTLNDISHYLQKGFSASRAGSFGPMNEVVANSMRHMNDADIKAIATYIKELPAQEPVVAAIPAEKAAAGEKIYDRCKECHQASGRGGMFSSPPLAGSAVAQAADPSSLINTILYGPKTAEAEMGTFGSWETMKSYGDVLSDDDVAAVANYVRSAWGNVGGPVTAADVAKQR